ncbi:MAG: YcxB family protein [Lachnospiraceae bacterium]|nr:YcxB family protein [Lachnospiraceae bacterium]MEE1015049.1 YcxB family protein [Lachnospiraceae bacterium]
MKYEFDFQMDEKTLGDFYTSHNMGGVSGLLWPLLGVFAIVLAIISGDTTPISYRIIYVLFGFLFVFYIPFDLKRKAKKQVKTNPYYAQPIHYILDEEGVTTIQGENQAKVTWDKFSKIKLTKKSMFLYMRNKNACVLSLDVFGKDLDEAYDWIKSKVEQKK